MKRLMHIATAAHVLLLFQLGDVLAAGPYDGQWTGTATSVGGQCTPADVAMVVEGKIVTGKAKLELEALGINGTVSEDGSFGATIGFLHLTGKFAATEFEGTFKSVDCVWKMVLKRAKR